LEKFTFALSLSLFLIVGSFSCMSLHDCGEATTWYFMAYDSEGRIITNAVASHLVLGGTVLPMRAESDADGVIVLSVNGDTEGVVVRAGEATAMLQRNQIRSGVTNIVSLKKPILSRACGDGLPDSRIGIGPARIRVEHCSVYAEPLYTTKPLGTLKWGDHVNVESVTRGWALIDGPQGTDRSPVRGWVPKAVLADLKSD
jgi:hypothetical protein